MENNQIDYPVRVNYFDQINQATLLQDEREINRIRKIYALFSMIQPEIYLDGDKGLWFVTHYSGEGGTNITGSGLTPEQAVINWNKNWKQ